MYFDAQFFCVVCPWSVCKTGCNSLRKSWDTYSFFCCFFFPPKIFTPKKWEQKLSEQNKGKKTVCSYHSCIFLFGLDKQCCSCNRMFNSWIHVFKSVWMPLNFNWLFINQMMFTGLNPSSSVQSKLNVEPLRQFSSGLIEDMSIIWPKTMCTSIQWFPWPTSFTLYRAITEEHL